MSIAEAAGGDWPAYARAASSKLSSLEDDQAGVSLLADMAALFLARETNDIPTKVILEYLHGMEERPWASWGRHRQPMKADQLGRLLKPFGVQPRPMPSGKLRGYRFSEGLSDAVARYVGAEAADFLTTGVSPSDSLFSDPLQASDEEDGTPASDGANQPLSSQSDGLTGQAGKGDLLGPVATDEALLDLFDPHDNPEGG